MQWHENTIKTYIRSSNSVVCSQELFSKETKEIKEILLINGYSELIKRAFNQESKCLKNNIIYSPEKCPLWLVLPYKGLQSTYFERTTKQITKKAYYSVKPRVI